MFSNPSFGLPPKPPALDKKPSRKRLYRTLTLIRALKEWKIPFEYGRHKDNLFVTVKHQEPSGIYNRGEVFLSITGRYSDYFIKIIDKRIEGGFWTTIETPQSDGYSLLKSLYLRGLIPQELLVTGIQ